MEIALASCGLVNIVCLIVLVINMFGEATPSLICMSDRPPIPGDPGRSARTGASCRRAPRPSYPPPSASRTLASTPGSAALTDSPRSPAYGFVPATSCP